MKQLKLILLILIITMVSIENSKVKCYNTYWRYYNKGW